MRINKHDTQGTKPLLGKGELGYDDYTAGGDVGRVYVGTGTENIALAEKLEVDSHISNVDNPHSVTKAQVGLGNVDNTADANKNVLSAAKWTTARTITLSGDVTGSVSMDGTANVSITTTVQPNSVALGTDTTGNYVAGVTAGTGITVSGTASEGWSPTVAITNVGTAGTYTKVTTNAQGQVTSGTSLAATDIPDLDASKITSGTIDAARLPAYVDDVLEFANLASFPATGVSGKIYVALDTNKTYRWSGSVYVYITSGAVDSVNGQTGVVNITTITGNSGTATTLQTARTINGTSFNGSANITTANWGTGRTITIGSTGKTVDGSGNVSWTLAEIGAQAAGNYAASSHTHDDRYLPYSASSEYSNLPAGWYTIAVNAGNRASGKFILRDTSSGNHQSTIFYATHHYGSYSDITVLINSRYSGNPFRYLRIKDGSTYDGAMLQVYLDQGSNTVTTWLLENIQANGWIVKNWIADGTNPGDVSNFAALTEVPAQVDLDYAPQGGMITTGDIYGGGDTTQYLHLNTNNYNSYAPTLTGGNASGTWGISITGNSASTTKLATARTINGVNFDGTADITVVDSTKAPLASPALTGTPTAPTAATTVSTTQVATTAFATPRTSTTGSSVIPSGTTAQRDATPVNGYIRYNTTLNSFEGYVNGTWGNIGGSSGGGATGGGVDKVFYENDKVITTSYTITTGKNAMSAGDITINTGATVTIPNGSRWVIV